MINAGCVWTPAKIKKQIKAADKVSARMEAVQIAGFTATEATRFFGAPNPALTEGLNIVLRPPRDVRQAFTARHLQLVAGM